MNTYVKYCPNVFVAKCDEKHEKGETIEVTTKYGKENECIVFNLVYERNNSYYYSIVRADGFDKREWLHKRAERARQSAINANAKSEAYFEKANKDHDFLVLGEPINVGHHSERRHRKAIEDSWNNTGKAVACMDKAKEYESKAERIEKVADNIINLSMPESIEYFEQKLNEAKEYHEGLKSGKYERQHSYSMVYANKAVKDLQNKYDTAVKLWGE